MLLLKIDQSLNCPKCNGTYFTMKREAAYLYTYKINTPDTEQWSKENEGLSFLFDYREQLSDKEYLECEKCKSKFPCELKLADENIDFTILQKAIRSEYVSNPDFLG
jgi:DNA-directed RNA polymerase subunit RPC12/RpoP